MRCLGTPITGVPRQRSRSGLWSVIPAGSIRSRTGGLLVSMNQPFLAAVPTPRAAPEQEVRLSEQLLSRLLATTTAVHAAGLKSFGLLLADPRDRGFPY